VYCYLVVEESELSELRRVFGYIRPGEHVRELGDRHRRRTRLLRVRSDLEKHRDRFRKTGLVTSKNMPRFRQELLDYLYSLRSAGSRFDEVIVDDDVYVEHEDFVSELRRVTGRPVRYEGSVTDTALKFLISLADHVVNVHRVFHCNEEHIVWI
jgi:hypothetical protein